MMHTEKMMATPQGDFVLFLIGMRFNQPWKVHHWLPVVLAKGRRASAVGRLGRQDDETWHGCQDGGRRPGKITSLSIPIWH